MALALDGLFAASLAGLIVSASVFGHRGGETLSDNWILGGFSRAIGGITVTRGLLR